MKIKRLYQRTSGMIGRFLLFALMALFVGEAVAQSFTSDIYQAYISGDMDRWEKLMEKRSPEAVAANERYDLAMAHYGFIGYCMGRDQKQRARPYLDKVEMIADQLLAEFPDNPRYIALRGALYGFRISYQPQRSPVIGPKALKKVNLALEKGPDCPEAWVEAGNKDWWMPEIFGGSRIRAMANYEKAIQLMEKDPESIRNNWYYLNVHMILAAWYEERGRTFASREIYRKMVAFEPGFAWVREKLQK
jgi:tetratricopeptide (TPR) repeat protein